MMRRYVRASSQQMQFWFPSMLSVDERVGTESRAKGPAVHVVLNSAEIQMPSHKRI